MTAVTDVGVQFVVSSSSPSSRTARSTLLRLVLACREARPGDLQGGLLSHHETHRRDRGDRWRGAPFQALLGQVGAARYPRQKQEGRRQLGEPVLRTIGELEEEEGECHQVEQEVLKVQQVGRAFVVAHHLRQPGQHAGGSRRWWGFDHGAGHDLVRRQSLGRYRGADRQAEQDDVLGLERSVHEPVERAVKAGLLQHQAALLVPPCVVESHRGGRCGGVAHLDGAVGRTPHEQQEHQCEQHRIGPQHRLHLRRGCPEVGTHDECLEPGAPGRDDRGGGSGRRGGWRLGRSRLCPTRLCPTRLCPTRHAPAAWPRRLCPSRLGRSRLGLRGRERARQVADESVEGDRDGGDDEQGRHQRPCLGEYQSPFR